jgi:Bacterial membrane protein YfhO
VLTTGLLIVLYLGAGAAVVACVRWLRRPAPLRYVIVFWLLPIVFAFPGFFADRTILPVDHAMLVLPWSALGPAERHNPNLNDIATHMAPWAKAVRMAWKDGALPWRQRWNGCGMALAANGQSAAFSPFTFLMFALPLARAFTLLVAVKLFLALFGTWQWLSELGVSRTSALFGAVGFGLSGAMTPWILFPHTSVICLWPWALFVIELLWEEQGLRRGFWALTTIFFFWAVAGHPESAVLGGIFAVLWLLGRAFARSLPRPGRVFGKVVLAAAIALGLSAFLLVPEALAIARSSRIPVARAFAQSLPVRAAPHGPFWANGFFAVVFPRSLGDAVGAPMIPGGAGSFPEMALGYFGILGWAVALGIVRPGSRRKRDEFPLLALLLVGLGIGVALWPFFEIAVLAPVLKMMFVLRYFSWIALAGAALASFELDRLGADALAGRKSAFAFLAILAGLAAYALIAYRRFRDLYASTGGLASEKKAFGVVFVCLGAAAAIFLVARWSPGPFRLAFFSIALSSVAAAELLYQGMRLYSFGSPQELYPDTPMLAFLRSHPGPFRVVGEGTVLFPNSSIFAGLEDIRTKDPVERLDYVEFLNATCGYPPAEEFKVIRDVNAAALDFLNVRYLLSPPGRASPAEKWSPVYGGADGTVFENRQALPRVFAPGTVSLVRSRDHARGNANAMTLYGDALSGIATIRDWRSRAWVLGGETREIANATADVTEYREATNRISLRAKSSGFETTLVASLVQDGGWSARDETGRAIETSLANGPFLALRVPAGDHRILLKYSPPGIALGGGISLFSLAAVGAWALLRRRPASA